MRTELPEGAGSVDRIFSTYTTEAPPHSNPREASEALIKRLPAVVRVGPHDYQIVVMTRIEAEQKNIYGHHSPLEGVIRISPTFPAPTRAVATFLHECLHAIHDWGDLQDGDKEEHLIDVLATGLTGLFRDNPWLLGWVGEAMK